MTHYVESVCVQTRAYIKRDKMLPSFAIRGRYLSSFLAANTLCYTSNISNVF